MCHSLNCDDSSNYINISALVFLEDNRMSICALEDSVTNTNNTCGNLNCLAKRNEDIDCLYGTGTFWAFLILMVIGTIGFNVANSISDAICFDVLGENEEMKYGAQRLWGTLGYGITALISGYFIDYISKGSIKNYTPVFITVILCTIIDIASCVKLQLPKLPQSKNIFKDVGRLVQHHHIIVFLIFATLSGFLGSFISYFLFWYLEDLAAQTGDTYNIKLLEGLTIAAQSFGGEVLFFGISGKILKKLGYGHTLTVCFISYGLRFALISHIPSPWWILPIEFVMQGPTYALTYTTIVAYASVIAPPGTSATMQGVVAGMDDGFGYALGSIFAGFVYRYTSGRTALRIYALIGLGCGILHYILYKTCIKISIPKNKESQQEDVSYLSPNNAIELIDENSD